MGRIYQKRNGVLVDITPNVVPFMKYELCEVYYFLNPALRQGFVQAAGGLINNAATTYPAAFAYLQTSEGSALCVTEAEWQAMSTAIYYTNAEGVSEGWNGVGGVPKFVVDTANGTIRVPDLRGMYMEAAGLDSLAVGGVHGPGVPNINGSAYYIIAPYRNMVTSGAFTLSSNDGYSGLAGGTANTDATLSFNASRSSGAFGAGGAQRVRPRAWAALACVYLGS